ncbi:MAG: hypothetical protein PHX68_02780 [Alphaproteobacteria bacterium]|nr:hypothetical protein [Alphaproteobacteria bacterium]
MNGQTKLYSIEFLKILLTLAIIQFHALHDVGMPRLFDGNAVVNVFLSSADFSSTARSHAKMRQRSRSLPQRCTCAWRRR